jgi:hypothetical protein
MADAAAGHLYQYFPGLEFRNVDAGPGQLARFHHLPGFYLLWYV